DLDLHQLLYQRTHRFAKEVHIRSGLVKKLLQRDANVGGHGGFLLPCCCCSNTHGTRSWPLASREQPSSGIYTTTWDSSRIVTVDRVTSCSGLTVREFPAYRRESCHTRRVSAPWRSLPGKHPRGHPASVRTWTRLRNTSVPPR